MNLKLIVVHGRPPGKGLLFGPGDHYLGRGAECQVRFNSDWVSRQHCLLRVGPAGVTLRDLGSRNGTLVNGRLISQEVRLSAGDQLQIGPVVFEVRLEHERAPVLPPPTTVQATEAEAVGHEAAQADSTTTRPIPPEELG
jgi:pSer/pThr/pTyr-binding forkhead associated (FHA) protein